LIVNVSSLQFQQEFVVALPYGLWDVDGVCHRRAVLRPLSGREELMLAGAMLEPGAQSELLAACLSRLGDYDAVDAELTSLLTRRDRVYLALRLREQLYGDRIAMVARCPSPGCGAASDVDLRISELAPDSGANVPLPESVELQTPSGPARVRQPTGVDDALVHAAPTRHEKSALLWSRLVELDGKPLTPPEWARLPALTRHTIALELAESARSPELNFVARCPSCAAWLELGLDPFALLARELSQGSDRLLAELHCLAFHYHWSEPEILALPRPRRWRYLELLRRELEGRPLLDSFGRL
jgi:hypothetical protein